MHARARTGERRDPADHLGTSENDAFEQGAPRQQHVHLVRDALELAGQCLDRGAQQHEVGTATARDLARRAVRDLTQRLVESVEPEDEPIRTLRSEVVGVARVAGPDVDRAVEVRRRMDEAVAAPAEAIVGAGGITRFSGISFFNPQKAAVTAPPNPQMLTTPKAIRPSTGTM